MLKHVISYRCGVNEAGEESHRTHDDGDEPALDSRQSIADDGDDATAVRHSAAQTQREHHQEEQHGEQLLSTFRETPQNRSFTL